MKDRTMVTTRSDVDHGHHAYTLLKIGFVVAPLVAGIDKFFDFLTFWPQYLAPVFPNLLNISASTFMLGVGVIEVIAGVGVLFKPKIFAYVVSAWLLGIIVNLLILGQFYDIALRDLGLAVGAFALGQLAMDYEHVNTNGRREVLHRHDKNLSYS